MTKTVAIIGGGFSGTLVGLHLLSESSSTLRVVLVERSGAVGPGLAYRTDRPEHLLNVPAGNMSALPDRPDDFVDFLRSRDPGADRGRFASRRAYGEYLSGLLQRCAPEESNRRFTAMTGDAHSIRREEDGRARIGLADGTMLVADAVVLAMGHGSIRMLECMGRPKSGEGYIHDPWQPGALEAGARASRVLVVGSGLTALDVMLTLSAINEGASIESWSRHGLRPLAHRNPAALPRATAISERLMSAPASVRAYMRLLRDAVREEQAGGADWRDVVAGMRTITPALWRRLPATEKARFLRHVQPYWDVHRHRCAPEQMAALEDLEGDGRVVFRAARILRIVRDSGEGTPWNVRYRLRGSVEARTSEFDLVVNCTGPQTDLLRIDDPLLGQLAQAGRLAVDFHGLGLQVDARYRPVGADGTVMPNWFYAGPSLRAMDWEAIAVPELRHHVVHVARQVIEHLRVGRS